MTIERVLKHHSGEASLPEPETVGDWAGHQPQIDTHNPQQDWTEPWTPQFGEDEKPTIAGIVGQAIGAGSMCWTSTPNGVFKSEQASWITGGAVNQIEKLIWNEHLVYGDPSQSDEGPQAPSRHEIEVEDLRAEISRYDDKLFLIERLVEQQAPFGSDLANFRRRLLLLVRA